MHCSNSNNSIYHSFIHRKGVREPMKIICSKSDLLTGVNIVLKAVPVKTTMTVLECILIDTSDGVIKLTATDMDMGIETVIEGDIIEGGHIALNAKLFSEIVRKLPDSQVTLETDESCKALITCEKAKFNIAGRSGDDFAALPVVEKTNAYSISQFSLKEIIRQTIFSTADNDANPIFSGELFEFSDNTLKVVALDGQRIAIRKIELKETSAMLRYSGGDARKLLNILELVVEAAPEGEVVITDEMVENRLQQNPLAYDKDGEMHYDIISAFIKSIRGSDPDAALYWLARMIEGGEDPQFIARRLIISASEDIGLANPNALLLANAAFDAVMKIGWPEGRIPLAEATVYLATSPKSNSAYLGVDAALAKVRETGNQPVPLPIRNAPTQLMKELGYHDGYKYPHDFPGHFTEQQYLPDALVNERFWHGQHNPTEEKLYQRMVNYWGKRYEE